jgi:hypothetical protein
MLSAEAIKRSGKLRKVRTSSAMKLFLEFKVIKYIIVPLTTPSVQGHIENRDNFSDAIRDLFLDTCHFSSVYFVSREINLIDSRRWDFNSLLSSAFRPAHVSIYPDHILSNIPVYPCMFISLPAELLEERQKGRDEQ